MFSHRIRRYAEHAFLALAASVYAASGYAGDGASMMPDTQTYCFGRFLIDLPKSAQLISQTSEFMFGEIKSERTWLGAYGDTAKNEDFDKMMKEREEALRKIKEDDGQSLKEVRQTTTKNARIFKTAEMVFKELNFGFEAYRWANGALFSMKETNFDQDKIDSVLHRLETRLLPNLRTRKPNEIPGEPGFCIKDGFIADDGQTPQYEKAELFFRFKEWPDVTAEVYMIRGGKIQPSLLERVKNGKIPALFAEAAREVKTFRKGKHNVGPLQGEEILEAYPTDESYFIHHLVWDTQGKLDSATEPAFYFELRTGIKPVGMTGRNVRPTLTDKQAIELFDAIVNSIRLRPTTPGKTSEAAPKPNADGGAAKRLPLGTKVSSLRSCPESGIYECVPATPGVTDRRIYLEQGRPMPAAFVMAPKRGITGFLGGQEQKEVEMFWTLVAYGQDKS